jgi:hypothetical protein
MNTNAMNKPTRHHKLNPKQLRLLKLLFKFRFTTSSLLATYNNRTKDTMQKALTVLINQELVSRHYNKNYKLLGKAARYYLAPKALRLLRDEYDFHPGTLHTMYKNKSVNETFIDQHLDLQTIYLNFNAVHPEGFNIYTKYELGKYDHFPHPAPDLYLSRKVFSDHGTNEYLLDVFTDAPLFVIKKRVARYLEHYDGGYWAGSAYPAVLIACPDPRTEERLLHHLEQVLESLGEDELVFYTTTTKDLLALESDNKEIWTNAYDPEVLVSL